MSISLRFRQIIVFTSIVFWINFTIFWLSFSSRDLFHKKQNLKISIGKRHDDQALEVLAMRKNFYLEGCRNLSRNSRNKTTHVIINDKYRLAYCPVAKAGCTFWKRLFRYLVGDVNNPKEVKNLFQIDRFYVHYAPQKYHSINYASDEGPRETLGHYKFMFARDPYQRLWSAYLEKFLLPDFWLSHGPAILQDREISGMNQSPDNGYNNICPDDISFAEFLKYSLRAKNEHWSPVSTLCDPCTFKPDVVGKVESFTRDRDFILKGANLSHLVGDEMLLTHQENEVETILDYNFNLSGLCISWKKLARRLWTVFQYNGYIREDTPFPEKQIDKVNESDFLPFKDHVANVFIDQVRQDALTKEESRNQRRAALNRAYRNISQKIKQRLQSFFVDDFVLFGYKSSPPAA